MIRYKIVTKNRQSYLGMAKTLIYLPRSTVYDAVGLGIFVVDTLKNAEAFVKEHPFAELRIIKVKGIGRGKYLSCCPNLVSPENLTRPLKDVVRSFWKLGRRHPREWLQKCTTKSENVGLIDGERLIAASPTYYSPSHAFPVWLTIPGTMVYRGVEVLD